MTDAQTLAAEALSLLRQGDPEAAFHQLRPALSWPGPEDAAELSTLLEAVGTIMNAMAGPALGDLFRAAARQPPSVRGLRDLGYGLMDVGLPELAAVALARARELGAKDEGTLSVLASALEQVGLPGTARAMLRGEAGALATSPALRHQLALLTALSGDLAELRQLLPRLGAPADDQQRTLAAFLQRVLYRADQVSDRFPLDDRDLRGWHWVLSGGLLTHLSPYGFDEGMNGRYAFVQDSGTAFLHGLARLKEALEAMGERPAVVYAVPDRDSEIAATAAARFLGLPIRPWPLRGIPAPGLVVAYDLRAADPNVQIALLRREPGQVLWAHVGCWTEPAIVSPDVVTLLAQHVIPPWGEQVRLNPDTGEVESVQADEGSPDEIATKILASEPAHEDDRALDAPERAALVARALASLPETRPRERGFVGSPVSSARFA